MKREPDMDSAAYRDKQLKKKYDEINNPKRPTEGQLLGESGDYLKDPETEVDTSQPLQSATNPLDDLTINPNRKTLTEAEKRLQDKLRKRAGTGQQGADIAKEKLEKKGGSATDLPPFLQVHKEADPIIKEGIAEDMAQNAARDKAIEEVIKSTEPKSQERLQGLKDIAQQLGEDSLGYGLMALQKYGEVIDWTNDQVNLRNNLPSLLRGVETPIDALLDYSYKDLRDDIAGGIGNVVGATTGSETANTVAEIGAQILLPDAMDFRTGGLGYLDNIGRAALKLRKADGKFINDAVNFADNLVFQIRQKLGGEGNLELAGIGMRINKNNVTDTFYQAKGVSKGGGGINPIRQPEVPQLARMYFARSGLRDGVFNLDTWRKAGSDRNVMELFQTRWDQVPYRTKPGKQFTSTRERLIKPFLEEHENYLKKFDIDPSTIELHHIFGVNLSAPLYDGLQYGSKEWLKMTDELNRLGVFPGAPSTSVAKKSNLMLALKEPHDLLHQQFFKDKIGYFGEKFFNQERMDLIRSGLAGRNQVAQEYAKIIKQGETLIQRGMDQIQNVFGKTDVSPEKLADAFSQSLADGTTNIFKEGYKIESVNEVIKELVFDIQIDEMITPLKQKAFGTIDELKQEILLDKAAGLSQKQLKKKYGKKFDIKQFDLFE